MTIHVDNSNDTGAKNAQHVIYVTSKATCKWTHPQIWVHAGSVHHQGLMTFLSVHHSPPSDHSVIACFLDMSCETHCRKFCENFLALCRDIISSSITQDPASDMLARVEQYNHVLSELLDNNMHPLVNSITHRPHTRWYTACFVNITLSQASC